MITAEQVRPLVEEKIAGTDYFIVELDVKPGNKIQVVLDSDSGVTIDFCVGVHRHIEKAFDREVEDFELLVSSAGVGQPLRVTRQYRKNVGRYINVRTVGNEKLEGVLASADDEGIVVNYTVKEEVPGKKGKKWVDKTRELEYVEIAEAKVVVKF